MNDSLRLNLATIIALLRMEPGSRFTRDYLDEQTKNVFQKLFPAKAADEYLAASSSIIRQSESNDGVNCDGRTRAISNPDSLRHILRTLLTLIKQNNLSEEDRYAISVTEQEFSMN